MKNGKNNRRTQTLRAAARMGIICGAAWLATPRDALGTTFTWIGASDSWGNAADWVGTGPVPPNATSAEAYIGNTGTVSMNSGSFTASFLHVGHIGLNNPGTAQLNIDSGTLILVQNITVGEGNAGSIVINGGNMTTTAGKNFWLGGGTLGTATGYLEIDSGTLTLMNKTGIVPWTTSPGASTINMSGGVIDFAANTDTGDNADTILAGDFNFSGGFINNLAISTINELSGNGSINFRNNSANAGLTVNQSTNTTFDGIITNAGGASGASRFTKTGAGSLNLGADAVFNTRTLMSFNGGTVKLGKNETFTSGSMSFAGGTLALNGFAQTAAALNGNGTIDLGTNGQFNLVSSAASSYSGAVIGSGTFTKSNSGVYALSANQTFTGQVTVSNGTIALTSAGTNNFANVSTISVTGTGNLDASAVAGGFTLAPSQLLNVTGHIAGNVSVPSGTVVRGASSNTFTDSVTVAGTVGANGGVGSMSFGSLTLNSAALNVELNGAGADLINVVTADKLSLLGTSTISLTDLSVGSLLAGVHPIFDYAGTSLTDLGHLSAPSTFESFNVSLVYGANTIGLDFEPAGGGGITWNVDSDGTWSTGGNWTGGTAPNAVDAVANFGTIIMSARTVTLDGTEIIGTANFSSPISYTISGGIGSNSLTLSASGGTAAINVTAGSHTISAPVILNNNTIITTDASTGIALTGNLTATGVTVTKAGTGTAQFNNVRAAGLAVSAGTVTIASQGSFNNAAGTSIVGSLSISSGAVLDLTDNAMVINYSTLGTLLGDTRQALKDAQLVTTSTANHHALGYADNATLGRGTFGGVGVGSLSVLVAYTFAGDANLDGTVNALDFNAVAANYGGLTNQVWTTGDFNYDGLVNTADFSLMATSFGLTEPAPASVLGALVPEPASLLAMTGFCMLTLPRKRRRRE